MSMFVLGLGFVDLVTLSSRMFMLLQMGVAEGWIYVLPEGSEGTPFRAYDPIAAKWSILPPTPGRSEGQQWQGFACVALAHKFLLIGGTRSEKSLLSDRFSSGAFLFSLERSFFSSFSSCAFHFILNKSGNSSLY